MSQGLHSPRPSQHLSRETAATLPNVPVVGVRPLNPSTVQGNETQGLCVLCLRRADASSRWPGPAAPASAGKQHTEGGGKTPSPPKPDATPYPSPHQYSGGISQVPA